MSTLDRIQKYMKFFKILTLVTAIFSFIITLAVISFAFLVKTNAFDIESITITLNAGVTKEEAVNGAIAAAISICLSGILSIFIYRYFASELKDGTPFTFKGAEKIKTIGILSIVFSFISSASTSIFDTDIESGGLIFGIFLILISTVIKYGAELEEKNQNNS